MMAKPQHFIVYLVAAILLLAGCTDDSTSERLNFEEQGRETPQFNADSAYQFVQDQVDFGPRNPGSKGHQEAKEYFLNKLRTYASERSVYPQNFTAEGYDEDTLDLTNIIASFNTQSSDRIMLCAHWDTRPRADQDPENPEKPILGADDGGSGVGVLLELARLFKDNPPPIGVDIVLFDGEDYGKEGNLENYFLGSRYWTQNPPVEGYSPRFVILLDMVGGEGAQFPKEGNSMQFAPALVNEVWSIAENKGYEDMFLDIRGNAISDDHVVINRNLGIPTINIIRHDVGTSGAQFAPYWHTHQDNMNIISRETLSAVGHVVTELIYNRIETTP